MTGTLGVPVLLKRYTVIIDMYPTDLTVQICFFRTSQRPSYETLLSYGSLRVRQKYLQTQQTLQF